MAQQRGLPLRVQVPENSTSERFRKYQTGFSSSPATPTSTPVIHQRPHSGSLWVSILLQLCSLYAAHQWLGRSAESSIAIFAFLSLLGASIVLGLWQRPWRGRAVTSQMWGVLLANGGVCALSFILRLQGLRSVGPLATILAEYTGVVIGKVLLQSPRRVHGIGTAKVRGGMIFAIAIFLISQGWVSTRCSPLSRLVSFVLHRSSAKTSSSLDLLISDLYGSGEERIFMWKECQKHITIATPILAGLLSSIQKILPSRTGLKVLPKKRVHALTFLIAAAILGPLALYRLARRTEIDGLDQSLLWPLLSTIMFGLVIAFYGEVYSEEKLQIAPASFFHFFVTCCCICILELLYGLGFSLIGFFLCTCLLGFGVREAAFITGNVGWGSAIDSVYPGLHPSFNSLVKSPWHHIMTDPKSRKIAMFLLMNTSFMVVEFSFGFLSNSLGLISDACHMLFDCAALAIGLYASYISGLPANSTFPYGYGRFEVLSGYANGIFLILVASLIVLESLERILEPPEISTESILIVSVGGLLVNIVGLMFFHEAHHHAHGGGSCTHSEAHKHAHSVVPQTRSSKDSGITKTQVQSFNSGGISDFQQQNPDSPILSVRDPAYSKQNSLDNTVLVSPVPELTVNHSTLDNERSFIGFHHPFGNISKKSIGSHDQHPVQVRTEHHQSIVVQDTTLKLAFAHATGGSVSSNREHKHGNCCEHSGQFQNVSSGSCLPEEHGGSGFDTGRNGLDVGNGIHSDHHNYSQEPSHHHKHQEDHPTNHQSDNPSDKHDQRHGKQPEKQDHSDHNKDSHHQDMAQYHMHHLEGHPDHSHLHEHNSDRHPEHGQQQGHQNHLHQHQEASHNLEYGWGQGHSIHSDSCCQDHKHVQSETLKHIHDHHHNDGKHYMQEHVVDRIDQHDHSFGDGHGHAHDHRHDDSLGGDHGHGHNHGHDHNYGDDHGHALNHTHDHDDDHHHQHHDIDHNMEGIFLHILADTLGSVGVVISTLLIKYKGWLWTDPACSIFISVLIISSVIPLVRNAAQMLLQRVPRSTEKAIQMSLKKLEEVEGVHDWNKLHIWSYTNIQLVGSLSIHATGGADKQLVRQKVSRIFQDAGIMDLIVQVEDMQQEAKS